jgi:hypothetical protein
MLVARTFVDWRTMAGDQDVVGAGRVVAPAALAVIAQIAASAFTPVSVATEEGEYDITVNASVSGNAAADTDNMALFVNGAALASPLPHGVSGGNVPSTYRKIRVDGVNPIQVQAIGIGTAAIVYAAEITATPTA